MLEDYEDSKHNLLKKWRECEDKIEEGCAGGVCSIGGVGKGGSTGSNFSHSGDGTKVASLNGMTRQQEWQPEDKEGVEPQQPNTEYADPDARPFTGEEKYDEYWTQKELKIKDGYKIEENEVRMDDPTNTQNDLSHRYAQMLSAEDQLSGLQNVTDHFEQTGQDYDVMVRVGETTKSVPEWEAEIERTADDGLPPEVPTLPPTEGGHAPEETGGEEDLGSMMPFPELGDPPIG